MKRTHKTSFFVKKKHVTLIFFYFLILYFNAAREEQIYRKNEKRKREICDERAALGVFAPGSSECHPDKCLWEGGIKIILGENNWVFWRLD